MREIAIICCLLLAAAQTLIADPLHVDVAVVAPPSDELLNDIFTEAAAIWAPADVTLPWHRSVSGDAFHRDCLLVTFERSTTPTPGAEAVVGWIAFESGRPAHTIHLAAANAGAVIHRTLTVRDAAVLEHDVLVGRGLGRALAHETGHYLLPSKVHSAGGLMRPAWPAEAFLAPDRSRVVRRPEAKEAVRSASPVWAPGEEL